MAKVYFGGKLHDTAQPKVKKWKKPEVVQELFANCPDCDQPIYKLTSCWWMRDKITCIDCHEPYLEAGIGHHAPAGWDPPGITLEG